MNYRVIGQTGKRVSMLRIGGHLSRPENRQFTNDQALEKQSAESPSSQGRE